MLASIDDGDVIYIWISKIAIHKILDDDGITAYVHGTNMPFIKYFDDKDKRYIYFYCWIYENP